MQFPTINRKINLSGLKIDFGVQRLKLIRERKKNIFFFTVDDINPLLFDTGNDTCKIIIEIGDEYFSAKAIYDMMKPGFRHMEINDYIIKEKQSWIHWFEKNLKDYSSCYTSKILEK